MSGFPVALGPVGYPLPACYSVGCYPIIYLDKHDHLLCPKCANDPECELGPAVLGDVHWEGEPLECDACGECVESAYGPTEGK